MDVPCQLESANLHLYIATGDQSFGQALGVPRRMGVAVVCGGRVGRLEGRSLRGSGWGQVGPGSSREGRTE